jgi:hypothetical protein
LQQIEGFGDPTVSVNDCFRPVSRWWDRITRPEQILESLPQALRVLTDPADCGPVTLALPQDVQTEAYDYPEAFFAPHCWRLRRPPPDAAQLADAAAALTRAKAPLIVAGGHHRVLLDAWAGRPLLGGDRLYPPNPGLVDRVWQATFTVEGARRAGAAGDVLMLSRTQPKPARAPHLSLPEIQHPMIDAYLGALPQGRAPRILASRTVFVADDRNEAMRLAEIGLARQRARYAVLVDKFGVPRSKLAGQQAGAARRLARATSVPLEELDQASTSRPPSPIGPSEAKKSAAAGPPISPPD